MSHPMYSDDHFLTDKQWALANVRHKNVDECEPQREHSESTLTWNTNIFGPPSESHTSLTAVGKTTGITYAIRHRFGEDAILTYCKDGVDLNPTTTHSSLYEATLTADHFDQSMKGRLT